jgi:phage minor structural protein
MIPILYEKNETAFASNGICRLPDMISGTVTEERNGIFIAEFEYPVDGENYAQIQIGRIILCSCSQGNKQPFEIYEASRPLNGRVIFTARHLTYRGNFIAIEPFSLSNTTPQAVMESMRDNHVIGRNDASPITCPFTLESTITSLNNYMQTEPAVFRSRLGGSDGSILDVWGGEYEWGYDFTNQRPKIKLWGSRGQNNGVQIKYGKNLIDLQQEESIENMITAVVVFFKNDETCVYSDVVRSNSGGAYTTYQRIGVVDVSNQYGEIIPTKAQLNTAAQAYINSHNIGVPDVNLEVSFVNLADTEEYKDIAVLERVNLCDTVLVYFEKLGVNAMAKVIKTVWNIALDKYDSIELGNPRSNMADQMIAQDDIIKDIKASMPSMVDIQAAIDAATDLITGQTGGYVVIEQDPNNNNKPKRILVMDTDDVSTATKVWQFNLSGIGYSKNGVNGTYTSAFVVDDNNNGYLNTQMIAANSIEGNKIAANTIETGNIKAKAVTSALLADAINTSLGHADEANMEEQLLYYAQATSTPIPSAPVTWVSDTTGDTDKWTKKRPEYSQAKPICFIAKQSKNMLSQVTCTTPMIDDTTTVIDGGHIIANSIDLAKLTAVSQAALAQGEQYIYKTMPAGTVNPPDVPKDSDDNEIWVDDVTGAQNTWTVKRPQYDASYPACFIAKQKKDSAGTVTCTTPMLDDTTTVIDGGHITTGIISAASGVNTINMLTGAFSLANGNFKYDALPAKPYIELQNNLSLRLNGIPLAGNHYHYKWVNGTASGDTITWDSTALSGLTITIIVDLVAMPYMALINVWLSIGANQTKALTSSALLSNLPIEARATNNISIIPMIKQSYLGLTGEAAQNVPIIINRGTSKSFIQLGTIDTRQDSLGAIYGGGGCYYVGA